MTTILFTDRTPASRSREATRRGGYPSSRFPLRWLCKLFRTFAQCLGRDGRDDGRCQTCPERCDVRREHAMRGEFHLHNQHNRTTASPRCVVFTFVVTGVADIEIMY
jgi:hypothetical protein